jgi:hypothetical protein
MKCAYDGEEIEDIWESGKTYEGVDEHHNPPQFLMENWEGETYYLCRKHHVELHKQIKIILNRIAGTMKFCNSEDWLLKKMNINQIRQARQEVYDYTKRWINNGNTK